ncbi:MAG: hypothetical protein HY735_19115 [Verrucomicrobia bacterium]|nr:hypothetical protein [Verrucomicrobiota bacterium]
MWLPLAHRCFTKSPDQYFAIQGIPPKAEQLAARHIQLWSDPAFKVHELERMRRSNAEWDFMGRSYLVWTFTVQRDGPLTKLLTAPCRRLQAAGLAEFRRIGLVEGLAA